MSKRNEPGDSHQPPPIETGKKPRLDLEEQIKRAGALATRLHEGIKYDADTKASAANQIAGEELLGIFENLQNKAVSASQSVDDLISAQIRLEVHRVMNLLASPTTLLATHQRVQINNTLKPINLFARECLIQRVQQLMESFTDGNYVANIKQCVKAALVTEYQNGAGAELSSILNTIL